MMRRIVLAATVCVVVGATSWVVLAAPPQLDAPAAAVAPARRVGLSTPGATTPSRTSVADAVVGGVNGERTRRGLTALSIDADAVEAARAHSTDMADRATLTHTGSDGSDAGDRLTAAGYRWRSWGEAVAAGHPTPEAVVRGWMDSPPHRAILLSDSDDIGVAMVRSAEGTPYWTLVVGVRR